MSKPHALRATVPPAQPCKLSARGESFLRDSFTLGEYVTQKPPRRDDRVVELPGNIFAVWVMNLGDSSLARPVGRVTRIHEAGEYSWVGHNHKKGRWTQLSPIPIATVYRCRYINGYLVAVDDDGQEVYKWRLLGLLCDRRISKAFYAEVLEHFEGSTHKTIACQKRLAGHCVDVG